MPNTAELQVQLRRGTAAEWTSADPILLFAEIGYEIDTGFWKWGDGSTAWSALTYDHQFAGDLNVAGVLKGAKVIAGDPGLESTGITVNGALYESVLKASDIGGANAAQFIMHRHSTTLPAIIIGARSKTDDDTHAIVANNDVLLNYLAAGHDGVDYAISSEIRFEVDGVPDIDDMPGRIRFMTARPGTQVPLTAMIIDSLQDVGFVNNVSIFGALFLNTTTVITTSHTATNEHVILVDDDTAGGDVTIDLPPSVNGLTYHIKKLGSTASVIVDGDLAETIDEGLTAVLIRKGESMMIIGDGSNWHVI
jgi:hypothetical protein